MKTRVGSAAAGKVGVALSVALCLVAGLPLAARASGPTYTWTLQAATTSPSPRSNAAMAYDADTGEDMLFGGRAAISMVFGDTWAWNGTAWHEQHPTTSPSARIGASMAYDAAHHKIVLFGGAGATSMNDTWTWDGTDWTHESPATSPPARDGASMAYDAAHQRVVLFGGSSPTGVLGDTWTWDGTNWAQQTSPANPSARATGAMAYDAVRQEVVLFGGCCAEKNDTWVWNGTAWAQRTPASSPPARSGPATAFSAPLGKVVMLVGAGTGSTIAGGTSTSLETWTWDGTNWQREAPLTSPQVNAPAAVAAHDASGSIVMFGSLGDTWAYAATGPPLPVAPGGPSPTASTVIAAPTSVPADGTTPSTVTVTLKDVNGAPAPGRVVRLDLLSGQAAIVPSSTGSNISDLAGVATLAARSTFPGSATFRAFDFTDSVTIAQTATVSFSPLPAPPGSAVITTVAGGGEGDGGSAIEAVLQTPTSVALDANGNLFISDIEQNRVRKVSTSGTITAAVGTGTTGFSGDGGQALAAGLGTPTALAFSPAGELYFNDRWNFRIRKVSTAGIVSTVAGTGTGGFSGDGGPATAAKIGAEVGGMTFDSAGNLYFADTVNQRVRRIDTSGVITTAAGIGTEGYSGDGGFAQSAQLASPYDVAIDAGGNLYISDPGNSRIRKVTTAGIISTYAGNGVRGFGGDGGPATSANVDEPWGLKASGTDLYIADRNNHRVRKVDGSGTITTVAAGCDNANICYPSEVDVDASGNLYVDNTGIVVGTVSKVTPAGAISLYAGMGWPISNDYCCDGRPATEAGLYLPNDVATDTAGNLYITDTSDHRIRKVNKATGVITTVAGNGTPNADCFRGVPPDPDDGGSALSARICYPRYVAVDVAGNIYLTDTDSGRVRKVNAATGIISTYAGNGIAGNATGDGGPATLAGMTPAGLAVDGANPPNLYIADQFNNRVRKVDPAGTITTVAGIGQPGVGGIGLPALGDGLPATLAMLSQPTAVAVDSTGNLFIADTGNSRVRKVDTSGTITTVAGGGSGGDGGPANAAQLGQVYGVATHDGSLYISDTLRYRVRKVSPSGVITTIAGNGVQGLSGDGGPAVNAMVVEPSGMTVDADGVLYFADRHANRVRRVATPASASASTVVASPASVPADGTTTSTVTVTVKDANGVALPGRSVSLAKTSGPGSPTISAASGPSNVSGVVTFTVRSSTAGTDVFTATVTSDSVVISQTASVAFTSPSASASTSTVAASPASVPADGTTVSTITVTVKNAAGAALSGKSVSLAKTFGPGSPTVSAASGSSNASGVVTFTVKSVTQGTDVFTATVTTDSVVITQTASVEFNGDGNAQSPSP